MWPPYQKSGSRRLTLREPLWLSWLETFHMHCIRNNRGLKTDRWGTPVDIASSVDILPLELTN